MLNVHISSATNVAYAHMIVYLQSSKQLTLCALRRWFPEEEEIYLSVVKGGLCGNLSYESDMKRKSQWMIYKVIAAAVTRDMYTVPIPDAVAAGEAVAVVAATDSEPFRFREDLLPPLVYKPFTSDRDLMARRYYVGGMGRSYGSYACLQL